VGHVSQLLVPEAEVCEASCEFAEAPAGVVRCIAENDWLASQVINRQP
jgi:hypothetical protein